MVKEKISIKTGPPVEGRDFYGRKKDLQYAWKTHIEKGTSLLLSAPRRVGKSSFSKKMLEIARDNGWKTLYLDVEGISTESAFVNLFKTELQSEKTWANSRESIKKIFESIEGIEFGGVKIDLSVWRNNTYGEIKHLIANTEENILIVIDELTIYLNHLLTPQKSDEGREKVEFFLEWLRSFRQTTKARWILCSSIGIENFASLNQLSKHLNDFHAFPIGAFSEDEAKDFISRLDVDEKVQFSREHIQYILDKLVWHLPFFIQILVEKINFLIYVEGKQLSEGLIDEAYNRLITESYFNTWDERLKEYNEFEYNARRILRQCALADGESREVLLAGVTVKKNVDEIDKIDTVLSRLLSMLQNDGYLLECEGKYIFRSPLLRDFWRVRFTK